VIGNFDVWIDEFLEGVLLLGAKGIEGAMLTDPRVFFHC